MVNWNNVYTRLFSLIDREGPSYFSGGRFIRKVQEIDPYFLSYTEYIRERRAHMQSTTRRDYFRDILMGFDDASRRKLVGAILADVQDTDPDLAAEIRKLMGGGTVAPSAIIPDSAWNAERLNNYLAEIDGAITSGKYERAVSLSYTCLEGFLGAFLRARSPRSSYPNEIITLSKEVRLHLRKAIDNYPDEVLSLINLTGHAVDKARNRFSESHFGDEAGSWLATYVRDLVNAEIRLLLHFF